MNVRGRRILLGFTVDAATMALLNAMSVFPNDTRIRLINDFIVGTKGDNNWNELDFIRFYAAHDKQAATLNWINPAQVITEINSPSWSVDIGYTGNGSSSYLKTGFTPGGAAKFQKDSNSLGIYTTVTNDTKADIGFLNGSIIGWMIIVDTSSSLRVRNSSTTTMSVAIGSTANKFVATKRSVSTGYIIQNDTAATTVTNSSSSVTNAEFYELCYNANGTPTDFSTKRHACAFAGSGNVDLDKLRSRILTFLNAIGAN